MVLKISCIFIIDVRVKDGVVLAFIIFRGVFLKIFVLFIYKNEEGITLETPLNIILSSSTPNYSLSAQIYNLKNTSMTVSTKSEHYRHHKIDVMAG